MMADIADRLQCSVVIGVIFQPVYLKAKLFRAYDHVGLLITLPSFGIRVESEYMPKYIYHQTVTNIHSLTLLRK